MNGFDGLLYEKGEAWATIVINRPAQMNTLSAGTIQEFIAALDLAEEDDDVRSIVVTGAGDRAFCAGADLSAGTDRFNYSGRENAGSNGVQRDWGGRLTLRMFENSKPLIAAVNGASAGLGATMQAAMDIRIASKNSKYVFPFVRRGIVPDAASAWFLPLIVGLPTALEWCLTGRQISSEEALMRGMVRSLHEPDDLLRAAYSIAGEIAKETSPVAVALTRKMLWQLSSMPHPMPAHQVDSRGIQAQGVSADAREGIASFLEKRAPQFPGKISDGVPEIFPADWLKPEFS